MQSCVSTQRIAVELGSTVTQDLHAVHIGHFTRHMKRGLSVGSAVDCGIVVQEHQEAFHMTEQD